MQALTASDMVGNLLLNNDTSFADRICRAVFGKGVFNSVRAPEESRIWYICSDKANEAEELILLRLVTLKMRNVYTWFPTLEEADRLVLPPMGLVWALPVPALFVERDEDNFSSLLLEAHKSLILIRRRSKWQA